MSSTIKPDPQKKLVANVATVVAFTYDPTPADNVEGVTIEWTCSDQNVHFSPPQTVTNADGTTQTRMTYNGSTSTAQAVTVTVKKVDPATGIATNIEEYQYSFVYAKIGAVGFVNGGNSAFATNTRDVDPTDATTLVALKVPVQNETGADVDDGMEFYVSSTSNIQFFDSDKKAIKATADNDTLYPISTKDGHLTVYAAALNPIIANLTFIKASDDDNPATDVVFIPTFADGVLPGVDINNQNGVIPFNDTPGPFVEVTIPAIQGPQFPPANTSAVIIINDVVASDVVSLQAMINGVSVAKAKFLADGSQNKIYYLLCNTVFDSGVSIVTAYRASGAQSNQPDPNVKPRDYPAPTLQVRTVNNAAIFGGLAVTIPPNKPESKGQFMAGDKVTLTSYANGFLPGTNVPTGATILSKGTIVDPTKALTILVQEAPLHGISRSQSGIMGTYAADYIVTRGTAQDKEGTSIASSTLNMSTD